MRINPPMSDLPAAVISRPYYHGTSREDYGLSIVHEGVIKPRATPGRGWASPVPGRVYLTTELEYAMPYVLGGVLQGHQMHIPMVQRDGRYGFLFVVDGDSLGDVQPDEDWVGDQLYDALERPRRRDQMIDNLVYLAERTLAPGTLWNVRNGDSIWLSRAGKALLKKMGPGLLNRLTAESPHLSVHGPVRFASAWRFDKMASAQLTKDGHNFFDLAQKITRVR
jgi:hypothetical protein